jgi:hypothetical protein
MTTNTETRLAGVVDCLHEAVTVVDADLAGSPIDDPKRWFAIDLTHTHGLAADLLPADHTYVDFEPTGRTVGELLRAAEALTQPLPDVDGASALVISLLDRIREAAELGY